MNAHQIRVDGPGILALAGRLEWLLLAALGTPLMLLLIAAVGSHLIQHRPVWSTDPIIPKLSKLSPMAGAKRLFGKQAAANFAKGLFKLIALGIVMVMVLWPERHRLDAMVRIDPMALMDITRGLSLHLMTAVVAMLAIVATLDYLFQYRQWFERQKMSLQEVKEEYKQSEATPTSRAASVNSSCAYEEAHDERGADRLGHYHPTDPLTPVALQYERGMPAPICVAKGVDVLALKIMGNRGQARYSDCRKRALGARAARLGPRSTMKFRSSIITPSAEVISYVMKLKRGFSSRN